eukprot:TRINITY_DN6091_c0_g1_i7.p2 TRINITY_DN6091_c0_g1~~TRINITY_DN6091_c0_g1_i7.p2  ORF type:complete len:117 (+),score=27.91 TRINITY_DN6091_c0_g1_i7:219-569(+)
MARARSVLLSNLLLAVVACMLVPSAFVAPKAAGQVAGTEVDARLIAATFAGLSPLAVEQPAEAYDSVVAMLQSWLFGGIVLIVIYGAAALASLANPLTKRREQVKAEVDAIRKGAA